MKLQSSKLVHKDIREDHNFLKSILKENHYSTVILNEEFEVTYFINSNEQHFLDNEAEIIDKYWIDMIFQEDQFYVSKLFDFLKSNPKKTITAEYRVKFASIGEYKWVKVITKNLLKSDNISGIFLNIEDISEQKEIHEKVYDYAYHDHITGLTNRSLFYDRLRYSITSAHRNDLLVGVLFIHLDFTDGDNMQISFNDKLLKIVARKMMFCLRETDTISRYTKNIFGVIIPDLKKYEDISTIVSKINHEMKNITNVDSKQISIKTSIGISIYPNDSEDAGQLISYADMAMHVAKMQSSDNCKYYNTEISLLYKDHVKAMSY